MHIKLTILQKSFVFRLVKFYFKFIFSFETDYHIDDEILL